ncbi:MAG: hydrogenase iron-sulfur subunit [Deltaproteobacteria bacterium]|nr:hydrogenase iron-sulfur subunit [Deltaproteobacteria bacterium]
MARVSLCWQETPGLAGLTPVVVARAAGVDLDQGGPVAAAVVTVPRERAMASLKRRLAGQPVVWLDLAAEVGGGPEALRLARAAAAVARAAGQAAKATLPQVYAPQPALNVLVAGNGLAAVAAAAEAAALGHPVLLALEGAAPEAGGDDDPGQVSWLAEQLPAQVTPAPATRLVRLSGAAGDFRAALEGPDGRREGVFGAVMLAPPGRWAAPPAPDGLDPTLLRPLSGLAAGGCACQEKQDEPPAGWRYVAILAGVTEPLTSPAFDRAVSLALALSHRPRTQVVLLFPEARVAVPGGEARYRQAREAGVLAVKVDPGDLVVREHGRVLAWPDPLVGEEVELAPDEVYLAEDFAAAWPACLSGLEWPPAERLVPENPRLAGGLTGRSGLYLLGAARGTPPGDDRLAEAATAAAEMHHRLAGGGSVPLPAVRHTICATCLTCVRTCPHGVPRYLVDRIQCAPAGCVGCGVCAAECPAQAITPPGMSNPELLAALTEGLARAPQPSWVLFACRGSAYQALANLSREGQVWPAGMLAFPVACAGRVGTQLILGALDRGARGVLTVGCHEGNCRSLTGNLRAKLRTRQAGELLAGVGETQRPVEFRHLASNQPRELLGMVEEMAGRIGEV